MATSLPFSKMRALALVLCAIGSSAAPLMRSVMVDWDGNPVTHRSDRLQELNRNMIVDAKSQPSQLVAPAMLESADATDRHLIRTSKRFTDAALVSELGGKSSEEAAKQNKEAEGEDETSLYTIMQANLSACPTGREILTMEECYRTSENFPWHDVNSGGTQQERPGFLSLPSCYFPPVGFPSKPTFRGATINLHESHPTGCFYDQIDNTVFFSTSTDTGSGGQNERDRPVCMKAGETATQKTDAEDENGSVQYTIMPANNAACPPDTVISTVEQCIGAMKYTSGDGFMVLPHFLSDEIILASDYPTGCFVAADNPFTPGGRRTLYFSTALNGGKNLIDRPVCIQAAGNNGEEAAA